MRPRADTSKFDRWALLPLLVVALVVMIPAALLTVGTWLAGWGLHPVETASMAPAYPAGSLLVVEPVDPASVRVGMPIVFEDPARAGRLVTHRVTQRLPGDMPVFRTRGDANIGDDPYPVGPGAIRGRVRWRIVGAGTLVQSLRWPRNVVVLVAVPCLLLVMTEVRALRLRRAPVSPLPEGLQ